MKRVILILLVALFALSASAHELNVASFNIRNNSPKDYEKNDGWDQRKAILCDMINLEAFDIFGSQEVTKVQLDEMLAMLPDYDYIGVGRDYGDDRGEFCPIFYRKEVFEKLDGGTFWLSPTPDVPSKGWDAKYKRICTWGHFRHKASGKKICFMNVHFDHRGVQARIESAKLMLDYIKKSCKGMRVIVSGDYNVNQTSDSYKVLANSKILKDAHDAATVHFEPTGTFNGFNPKRYTTHRIDHLFVSKKLKVSRWGVLTYHYYRTPTAEEVAKAEAKFQAALKKNPKKKRPGGENREVKCLSDHYAIQAWVTLK